MLLTLESLEAGSCGEEARCPSFLTAKGSSLCVSKSIFGWLVFMHFDMIFSKGGAKLKKSTPLSMDFVTVI